MQTQGLSIEKRGRDGQPTMAEGGQRTFAGKTTQVRFIAYGIERMRTGKYSIFDQKVDDANVTQWIAQTKQSADQRTGRSSAIPVEIFSQWILESLFQFDQDLSGKEAANAAAVHAEQTSLNGSGWFLGGNFLTEQLVLTASGLDVERVLKDFLHKQKMYM